MDQSFFINEKESVVKSERILYTASSFAKSSLLYLQEIGTLTAKKKHTSRRSNMNSYLFMQVCSGSGEIIIDGIRYELSANDVCFIDCSLSYAHTTSEDDLWTLKWIHFNGEMMPAIYEKYLLRGGGPVLSSVHEDKISQIHENIFESASGDDYVRDMRINEEISSLLTILMQLSWDPEVADSVPKRKDMIPVKNYLMEHFTQKISLDELSEMFYVNKYYLTRIFKEQFGVSINTYQSQLKITRAKQLLRFTDQTLEEIAENCGIDDPNYFSRFFKKVEGMSPSAYRQTWRMK